MSDQLDALERELIALGHDLVPDPPPEGLAAAVLERITDDGTLVAVADPRAPEHRRGGRRPTRRLAWAIAPPEVIQKLTMAKQAADLHTSTFNQLVAYEVAHGGFLDRHIKFIRQVYKERRDAMLAAMDTYFPPEVDWTQPAGGLFLWGTLPEGIDSEEVLKAAIEQKVAKADTAIQAKLDKAAEAIHASRTAALANIEAVAAELAQEITGKVAGLKVTRDDAAKAVKAELTNG